MGLPRQGILKWVAVSFSRPRQGIEPRSPRLCHYEPPGGPVAQSPASAPFGTCPTGSVPHASPAPTPRPHLLLFPSRGTPEVSSLPIRQAELCFASAWSFCSLEEGLAPPEPSHCSSRQWGQGLRALLYGPQSPPQTQPAPPSRAGVRASLIGAAQLGEGKRPSAGLSLPCGSPSHSLASATNKPQ